MLLNTPVTAEYIMQEMVSLKLLSYIQVLNKINPSTIIGLGLFLRKYFYLKGPQTETVFDNKNWYQDIETGIYI